MSDEEQSGPILRLNSVSKRYLHADDDVVVLRGVDMELSRGETLVVCGPSGSGKSTLLNLVGGLDSPDSGNIFFDGSDVGGWPEKRRVAYRNRSVGFVFQQHHLLPHLNALENVLVPALVADGGVSRATRRAHELLERVGLSGRLTHRPGELSGGEQQRVAVARALINSPGIILADEPTGSLDRVHAESLMELLLEVNRDMNTALIIVTHAERLVGRFPRVLLLEDGKLVPFAAAMATPAEVTSDTQMTPNT